MSVDFVVKNCKLVTESQIVSAGLAVDRGKIVAVATDTNLPKADKTIDCKGNFVLPGIIDPHVHLGAWFPFKQDCQTESKAAAIGGITTFLHHITSKGSYVDSLKEHRQAAEKNSLIDFSFHLAIMNDGHLNELEKYVDLGITSFKLFMAYRGEEGEQLGINAADDGLLYEGFEKIGKLGRPNVPLVHAENVEIAYRLKAKLVKSGRKDLAAWSEARPNFCEKENIVRAASIAENVNSPLYIVHVSTAEGIEAISKLKRTQRLFAEVTPHHLTLTKNMPLGVLGKVGPPLRDSESIERLWLAIKQGTVDCIGSDHVPVTREKKGGDIWAAPPGLPGMGMILPIMVTEAVKKRGIHLEKIVEICSSNTAKALGLYPRKGSLQVGTDADFIVVDIDKKTKFKSDMLPSIADFSPYEGMQLTGWPTLTSVRGRVIAEQKEIVAKPGTGEFIPRQASKRG